MKTLQLNQRLFWSSLIVISLLALGIRLYGIGHGLPNIQTSDENSDLSTALRLTEKQIPPREVRYHRSLIAYVDMVSVGGLFAYTKLTGQTADLSSFRDYYFSDREAFTRATRLTLAVLTTLAIVMTGLVGRYISPLTGLLSALVLAVNGFFTLNSLYALPDSLIAFSIALCLWMSLRLHFYKRKRDYFIAGLSVAVVMLSKFSGSTIAIGIMVAHTAIAWEQSNHQWKSFAQKLVLNLNLVWLVLGVVIGNLVLNPLAFIHLDDLVYELVRLNSYAYAGPITLMDRVKVIFNHVLGIVPLIWGFWVVACILGVVAIIRYRKVVAYWIVLCAFLILTVTIANVSTEFYKLFYWIPWVISMALLSGIGLEALVAWSGRYKLQWGAYAVIIVLVAVEARNTQQWLVVQTATDTRQLALEYIQANWPADTPVVAGDTTGTYGVPLTRNEVSIQRAYQLGKAPLQSWDWWLKLPPEKRPQPAYNVYGPEMQAVVKSFDALTTLIQDERISYVLETDYCFGSINRPDSNSDMEYPAINDALRANWELVMTFSPYNGECEGEIEARVGLAIGNVAALNRQVRPGPVVRIYKVRTANQSG